MGTYCKECRGKSAEGNGGPNGCHPSSSGENGRNSEKSGGNCHARNETGHENTKCLQFANPLRLVSTARICDAPRTRLFAEKGSPTLIF